VRAGWVVDEGFYEARDESDEGGEDYCDDDDYFLTSGAD